MIFENRFTSTDEMMREYINKVICKKITLHAMLLSALSLLVIIIVYILGEYELMAISSVVLFSSICIFIFVPTLTFRQFKKSAESLHGGTNPETVVRFEDKISMSEGTINMTFNYSQIKRAIRLKHSYVLMIGKYNAIIVSPDHFTIGTFNSFVKFIEDNTGCKT